jgi:hypothetical protein
MQISSKKHWDIFIYGLLYPGFVGSMIYELIPSDKSASTDYLVIDTGTKFLITLFYCVDYLHLYGDMHDMVKPENRGKEYLVCDVGSSLFFFLSFVFVKHNAYIWALLFIAIVPLFFLVYKWPNKEDKKVHPWFLGATLIGLLLYIITYYIMPGWKFYESKWFLFWFVLIEFSVYSYYVFVYYNGKPKKEDEKLYPKKVECHN